MAIIRAAREIQMGFPPDRRPWFHFTLNRKNRDEAATAAV
jgi:hypothetical protein